MGYCILNISVDEFYRLFFDDEGPFNISTFFEERGDKNTTRANWQDPIGEHT